MASFDTSVRLVLKQEGSLSFDPHDAGGLTRFGISRAAYPSLDIAALTEEQAIEIYRRDYWQFDGVQDQRLANLLLSMCVNNGKGTAIQHLQKVLGLVQDGVWGRLTERAANNTPGALTLYANRMILRYVNVAAEGANQAYLKGWVQRVLDCLA